MWLAIKLALIISTTSPESCGDLKKGEFIGCYYYDTNKMYVDGTMSKKAQDFVALHEVAHYLGIDNESEADYFAHIYMPNFEIKYYDLHPERNVNIEL